MNSISCPIDLKQNGLGTKQKETEQNKKIETNKNYL
jgi:hypothetical protein